MTSVVTEALLGAVAPLHEAPQELGAWNHAFDALARAIPCEQGALIERLGRAEGSGFGLVIGTDQHFMGEYQREYHRVDPFASEDVLTRLHDLGRAAMSGEVLPDMDMLRSPFYTQFLARHGDLFNGLLGSFSIAEPSHASIWLLRSRGHAFTEDERRCLDVFASHARAALRQRRWLARMERERDAALAWMDCWSDATFVMDAQGGLLIANVMAERLLRGGDLLALRDGRLRPARLGDPDWLTPLLKQMVLEARRRGDSTRCLALPRRTDSTPLHAVLTTLPATPGRSLDTLPRIALVLRDLRQALPHFEAAQLKELFAFTAAEARVANALLAGQSVEDIANESSVRRDTVRAHVKRMLAKTGSRRQSDLQKLLVKALPNLRSLHAAASQGLDS